MKKQIKKDDLIKKLYNHTHNMIVCSNEDLEKWKKGEIRYDYSEWIKSKDRTEWEEAETYYSFMDDNDLDIGYEVRVTPSGETINIIYKYDKNAPKKFVGEAIRDRKY